MKIIPDSNTALLALEKGEVDESGIPAKDFKRYTSSESIDIHRYYDLVYTYLGFNLNIVFSLIKMYDKQLLMQLIRM